MNDLIEEKDNVLSFTLYKVERGREKICRCNPPHLEIDTTNRIVVCKDCGATIDPFEALLTFAEYAEEYEKYQDEALEKINSYREMANEELRRKMRNKAFKDMDSNYRNGMYPYCPKCGEMFDPMKLTHWGNKKFYEEREECLY